MKVLVIGSGGREYAIAKSFLVNNKVKKIFIAPGNGGTELLPKTTNIKINNDNESLLKFALENNIDITFVGSETFLMNGIVDIFQKNGLRIFGPHKKAALLEGSKTFAKEFMSKYGIKTAKYKNFTNFEEAINYIKNHSYPLVIKASGLAAGKGVIICNNFKESYDALHSIMIDKIFNDAGNQVVIEEFLQGQEISILSVCDGKTIIPFISARDHKRIGENETGLNTGGMGVIAPVPYATNEIMKQFEQDIMLPTLKGIINENLEFCGVIFFGVMISNQQVYLLEYNMRMGDPETQTLLPLLKTPFIDVVEQALNKKLCDLNIEWYKKTSCCVVLASSGYPLDFKKGLPIYGIEQLKDEYAIAGAELKNNQLYTSGGRVINILGFGNTLEEATRNAYINVEKINFSGKTYRKDIGNYTK